MSVTDLPLTRLNDLTVEGWADWLEAVLLGQRPSGVPHPPHSEPHFIVGHVFDAVPRRTRKVLANALADVLESTVAEPGPADRAQVENQHKRVSTAVLYSTLQAVAKVRPRKAKQRVQRLLFDRAFVGVVHNEVIDLDLFLLSVVGEYDVGRNVRDWLLDQRERADSVGGRDLIALRLLAKSGGSTWLQYLQAVLRNSPSEEFFSKLVLQLKAILHRHGYMPFARWVTDVCTFPGEVLSPAVLRSFAAQFDQMARRDESLGPAPRGLVIAAAQLRAVRKPLYAHAILELAGCGILDQRVSKRALENVWRWRLADLQPGRIAEKPWEVSHNAKPYILTELDGVELQPEQHNAAMRLLKLERVFQREYGPRLAESARRLQEGI